MNIGEFFERLRNECRIEGLPKPTIDSKGLGTIKIRIKLKLHLHISIYYNEDTLTLTSALIQNGRRIFGYDAYPSRQKWHTHPLSRVERHEESQELSVEEIVRLYASVLERANIFRKE